LVVGRSAGLGWGMEALGFMVIVCVVGWMSLNGWPRATNWVWVCGGGELGKQNAARPAGGPLSARRVDHRIGPNGDCGVVCVAGAVPRWGSCGGGVSWCEVGSTGVCRCGLVFWGLWGWWVGLGGFVPAWGGGQGGEGGVRERRHVVWGWSLGAMVACRAALWLWVCHGGCCVGGGGGVCLGPGLLRMSSHVVLSVVVMVTLTGWEGGMSVWWVVGVWGVVGVGGGGWVGGGWGGGLGWFGWGVVCGGFVAGGGGVVGGWVAWPCRRPGIITRNSQGKSRCRCSPAAVGSETRGNCRDPSGRTSLGLTAIPPPQEDPRFWTSGLSAAGG